MLPLPSPLVGEGGSARSAETDEGCSRECQRLTPLEHPSSVAFGDTFSHKGPVAQLAGQACSALLGVMVDLVSGISASGLRFDGGGAALRPVCGRTYPVMVTHRRMLKAIAAIVT